MIDGPDGSGKSTVIQAWKDSLTAEGNAIFDLKQYWQTTGKYPELDELKSYDFIFSCEPTYTGVGKVIREELIKTGTDYSARAIAEAFSLDRLVLYTKLLIPLLQNKKVIIQDRGVSTSLCYQQIQNPDFSFEYLSDFQGNKLALENRPDHLVLMEISPEEALKRIGGRSEKHDDAIFEKIDFQKKSIKMFASEEFQNLFTSRGSKIERLNAEAEIDIMKQEAVKLLKNILNLNQ